MDRNFQEYLASYLKAVIELEEPRGIGLARGKFWDFDWHETLTLLADMLPDPRPLLQAIRDEKDDIFRSMLLLRGRCLAEGRESSDSICLEVIEEIYDFWKDKEGFPWFDAIIISLYQAHGRMRSKLHLALKDRNDWVRRKAAEALGRIGSPAAVPALTQALQDQDDWVRREAAEALGKTGSLEILKQLIQDPKIDFRYTDILSLARKLAIRCRKEKTDLIPVYPEVIARYRGKKKGGKEKTVPA
jgi:hypothetical protein